MKSLPKVEQALAWAAQQGYYLATSAAAELGEATGRAMHEDQPYHNSFAWRDAERAPIYDEHSGIQVGNH